MEVKEEVEDDVMGWEAGDGVRDGINGEQSTLEGVTGIEPCRKDSIPCSALAT